jgi:hypothetical protein
VNRPSPCPSPHGRGNARIVRERAAPSLLPGGEGQDEGRFPLYNPRLTDAGKAQSATALPGTIVFLAQECAHGRSQPGGYQLHARIIEDGEMIARDGDEFHPAARQPAPAPRGVKE